MGRREELNDAHEEIRRLKLRLGMLNDGDLEEKDNDKLRESMFKRMQVMDDLEELRGLREECQVASDRHEKASDAYDGFMASYSVSTDLINTLRSSIDGMTKEIDENVQLEKDLLKQLSDTRRRNQELGSDIQKMSSKMNYEKDEIRFHDQHMNRLKEARDSSKEELGGLEKQFREMESTFNPKKRKEMEGLTEDFDIQLDISGKRNRGNSI